MSSKDKNTDKSQGLFEYVDRKVHTIIYSDLFSGHRQLIPIFSVAFFIISAYLLTHPYPAYGAGLFLEIAETIGEQGYSFPKRIAGYTEGGIPFAYPPLAFYVTAILLNLGFEPVILTRFLPPVVTALAFIPYYYLARELLPSAKRAGVAAIIATVTPPLLRWHLSAGGIVRAPAFLLLLTGLYVGIRLFREGSRPWLLPACILFGLTVLTHPTYSVFFGVSYVLFYITADRSLTGLRNGVIVVGSGLLIASPWLVQVATNHGLDILTAAAGTHGGLGAGLSLFFDRLNDPFATSPFIVVWYLLLVLGISYFVVKRRFFLPLWFGISVFLIDEIRFAFIPGVMLLTVGLTDVVPAIRSRLSDSSEQSISLTTIQVLVLGLFVLLGTIYVTGVPFAGQSTMPAFIDREDRTAMAWVQSETPSDADFVVLGDAAEWFPYLTERTILVGPWGVEWKTPTAYYQQMDAYTDISECTTARCLTTNLQNHKQQPSYIYIPKETYTVRGTAIDQSGAMRRSIERSDRYQIAYENKGVLIVRIRASYADPIENRQSIRAIS
ncbi:ArnT family glycosyltransferase [Haladaptatus sp. NG-SE-30]